MKKISLKDSYEAAITIMKDRAVSFYHAFSKLPKNRFQSIAAIYAFCRYADDLVDNSSDDTSASIENLKELDIFLTAIYTKEKISLNKPWWPALVDSIEKFNIPLEGFKMQLEGQRRDLYFEDMESTEELTDYAKLVAGSVGIMLAPLLADKRGYASCPDFLGACEALGIGMQITNILRDVGEDLRNRNRLYLPKNLLMKYNISRKELETLAFLQDEEEIKRRIHPDFIKLWEELAQIADTYYVQIETHISAFCKSCRIPLLAAALVYHAISDAVRKEGYNCFSKRCYTNKGERNSLILRAALYNKQTLFSKS